MEEIVIFISISCKWEIHFMIFVFLPLKIATSKLKACHLCHWTMLCQVCNAVHKWVMIIDWADWKKDAVPCWKVPTFMSILFPCFYFPFGGIVTWAPVMYVQMGIFSAFAVSCAILEFGPQGVTFELGVLLGKFALELIQSPFQWKVQENSKDLWWLL